MNRPQWSDRYEFFGEDSPEDDGEYDEELEDKFNLDLLIKDVSSSEQSEQSSEDTILNPSELRMEDEDEEEESSTVTPAKEPLDKKSKDDDTDLDFDDDDGQRKMG